MWFITSPDHPWLHYASWCYRAKKNMMLKMMINQEISMIVDPINDQKTHSRCYTSLK